jgi:hypothetical protein
VFKDASHIRTKIKFGNFFKRSTAGSSNKIVESAFAKTAKITQHCQNNTIIRKTRQT